MHERNEWKQSGWNGRERFEIQLNADMTRLDYSQQIIKKEELRIIVRSLSLITERLVLLCIANASRFSGIK